MRFCEPIARHIVDEIALILVRPGTEEPLDRRPKRQMRPSFNNSWLTGLRLGLVQAGPSADSLLTTLSGLRRQRLEALARKPHPFPEIVYERHARSYGGGLLGQ